MAPYANVPPLRPEPFSPDELDARRATWAWGFWHGQDELLLRRDRQVEENVRMLAGAHWSVYNKFLQKFIDITDWMTDEERRWRQRPVLNRVLYWYILTHARMTENPPIVTFLPSSADRFDADLAEVSDTIFKTKWRETGMQEVLDRMIAWMIPGGRSHLMTVVDPRRGDFVTYQRPARLSLLGPDGEPSPGPDGQPISRVVPNVPFDRDGNPLASLAPDGSVQVTGQPYMEREGDIRIDVLSCLEARGQWGPAPWHEKSWHAVLSFLTPEEVYELFGVEAAPENMDQAQANPGYLRRMLFGTGYFGAASKQPGSDFNAPNMKEGFVRVLSLWQRPCEFPGMEERPGQPGGRLLVVTGGGRVLRDGPRPFPFRSASSLRTFDFIRVMGRPSGTSPQEMLNPINRAADRMFAQVLEHSNLVSNPIALIDQLSGLQNVSFVNKPGASYTAMRRAGVPALEFIPPPPLGRDVYNAMSSLFGEMEKLGNVEGAEGRPPTVDPSGKLIRELRYNSDRFLGSTARRMVEELARMAQDWMAIFGTIWSEEKVIEYAGEDTVPRTITVYPELFKQGMVNVVPDIESMLPESRSERIDRVNQMYQLGAFGVPGTPQAVQKWLEMARFPHLGRAAWPGGVHVTTAQQENGELVRGTPATAIPVFEWYDHEMHLLIHEQFMSSPEYKRLPPPVQGAFVMHRQMHLQALLVTRANALARESALMGAAGVTPPGAPPSGQPGAPAPTPPPAQGQGDQEAA